MRPLIPMDKKRIATLAGTLVLAGAVVAAGVYGPSVWKVFRQQSSVSDQVVIQSPTVDGTKAIDGGKDTVLPDGTAPPTATVPSSASAASSTASSTATGTTPSTVSSTAPSTVNPPLDAGSKSKYREPDTSLMDLAPSVAKFFGDEGLSSDAEKLIFGAAWNIHEYVDGYLYGPAAGPQLNEQDIKKYIVFHKTLLDKQFKSEPNASKVAVFTGYLDLMLNRGIDAFDSKDKVRIEQFHQEIHDLDAHLMRNDVNSKIYGATPFATKRT